MARTTAHLIRNLDRGHGRGGRPRRLLATVTVLALLMGSVAPGWALAAEAESEGEGGGTAPPGLGSPGLEPGGPETVLEGLPGSGGEGAEEGTEGAPVETEPAQEPVAPEAPPSGEEPPIEPGPATPPGGPPAETPPPASAPAPPAPEYAPAPTTPAYETSVPPTAEPVENEALVGPEAGEGAPAQVHRKTRTHSRSTESPATSAPEAAAPTAALPPEDVTGGPGRIAADRPSYRVRPGDCLWSIAQALLPPGAGDTRIADEVARLWRLNADRIGTGDPDLIYAGTVLRLS